MSDKPNNTKPNKNGKPKGRRERKPRTIGTNVGQAIREAQERALAERKATQAAIMRRMAQAG